MALLNYLLLKKSAFSDAATKHAHAMHAHIIHTHNANVHGMPMACPSTLCTVNIICDEQEYASCRYKT